MDFFKNLKYHFVKILPVGVELSMQIDMTELIAACRSVMKSPKISKDYLLELFVPLLTRSVMIKMTMEIQDLLGITGIGL